jgi:tetratricopeptide (TPR) repeat protein
VKALAIIILLFVVFGVVAIGNSMWNDRRAFTLAQQGAEDFHHGNYPSAVARLERSVHLRSDIPGTQNALGAAYLMVNRTNDAKICFLNAVALNPNLTDVQLNLAILYRNAKNYKACLERLDAAIRLHPADPRPLYFQGSVQAELEEYDQAIESLKMALQQDGDSFPAWYTLGAVYYNVTNLTEAATAFTQAARIRPDQVEAHFYLGHSNVKLKRYKEAAVNFQHAIRAKPDYAAAYYFLGTTYLALHDTESAQIEYEKLRGLDRDVAARLLQQIQGGGKESTEPSPPHITG